MKVLIVEDDRATRKLLEILMKRAGAESVCAESVAEAVNHLADQNFEAVFTDWMMPGASGLELAQYLKKRESPQFSFVICLSGVDRRGGVEEATASGVDYFISRPVKPEELARVLKLAQRVVTIRNEAIESVSASLPQASWEPDEFDVILRHAFERMRLECAKLGLVAGSFQSLPIEAAKALGSLASKEVLKETDHTVSPASGNFVAVVIPADRQMLLELATRITREFAMIDPRLEPALALTLSREDDESHLAPLRRVIRNISKGPTSTFMIE